MKTLIFNDFESASRGVLEFLQQRFGFDLWMVTRTEGEDWIVLQSVDHGYGVPAGTVYRWADSFCSRMVKDQGPRIAPNSNRVAAYANAPIARQVQIQAYVGIPLLGEDGSLFGTLCAIHPTPQPEALTEELGLLEMLGAMLSAVLHTELKLAEELRRAEALHIESTTDALTQMYNRRGWDRCLASEEERCRRYGHSASLLIVDLDGLKLINDGLGHAAGDAYIVRAAAALTAATRSADTVARLGGDEFGILSAECNRIGAQALMERVRTNLEKAHVKASIGMAMRNPAIGLKGAWEAADQAMYEEKAAK